MTWPGCQARGTLRGGTVLHCGLPFCPDWLPRPRPLCRGRSTRTPHPAGSLASLQAGPLHGPQQCRAVCAPQDLRSGKETTMTSSANSTRGPTRTVKGTREPLPSTASTHRLSTGCAGGGGRVGSCNVSAEGGTQSFRPADAVCLHSHRRGWRGEVPRLAVASTSTTPPPWYSLSGPPAVAQRDLPTRRFQRVAAPIGGPLSLVFFA